MARALVLILEDDPLLPHLVEGLLAGEGFAVTLCADLEQVLLALARHPGSVVVADPWWRDDYQTLSPEHAAELAALGQAAPLILTTGRSWARQLRPGELNTAAILHKPFDLDDLVHAVRSAQEHGP